MKKLAFLLFIVVLLLPFLSACQAEAEKSYTPIPAGDYEVGTTGFTASDNLFGTPGGIAYAANVFDGDRPNPWPPIEVVSEKLGGILDNITVSYRADIETKAGDTRNNIINVYKTNGHFENNKLVLYANSVPDGISLAYSGGAGLPGSLQAILMIKISPQVAPGEYEFHIIIEIDGVECGSLPCTVNVIK